MDLLNIVRYCIFVTLISKENLIQFRQKKYLILGGFMANRIILVGVSYKKTLVYCVGSWQSKTFCNNVLLFSFIIGKLFSQYANIINVNDKFLLLIINYAERKLKDFTEAYYAISYHHQKSQFNL